MLCIRPMQKVMIALVAALLASPALADTLIHNANGIQVGADGKLQRFEAMLVGDDGKVVQTFTAVQNPHAPGAAKNILHRTNTFAQLDAENLGRDGSLAYGQVRLELFVFTTKVGDR